MVVVPRFVAPSVLNVLPKVSTGYQALYLFFQVLALVSSEAMIPLVSAIL